MENKVAREVAEQEFAAWAEDNDLMYTDDDLAEAPEDIAEQLRLARSRIIRAIEGGHLVINDQGLAEYTPHTRMTEDKSPLIFKPQMGATLMVKARSEERRMFLMMAQMTSSPDSRFAKVAGADLKVCLAITLFLAAG